MKPIEKRMDEAKARPEAINDTLTKLADFEKKAVNLNLTMPWVKENEKKDLVEILKNQNISSNY
jgi:hypoxia up-regulated 1